MPSPTFLSKTVYTANGTSNNFSLSFPYLEQTDVQVFVNNSVVAFSWLSTSTVQLGSTPTAGASVRIQRFTPITQPKVDYADGSTLSGDDLNLSARQALFALQEQVDAFADLTAAFGAVSMGSGNLPAVDSSKNGYVLQVVAGVWAVVPTTTVSAIVDVQVDGTTFKLQKKTQSVAVVGTPSAASGWTDYHTGTAC